MDIAHELREENDIDPLLLDQFQYLLNTNAPQIIYLLNQHGFIHQNDINEEDNVIFLIVIY